MDNLPRSIREYVANVPILIEDFPTLDRVVGERLSPQLLGLFVGIPRTQAAATEQVPDLDQIVLFKGNLEKICETARS